MDTDLLGGLVGGFGAGEELGAEIDVEVVEDGAGAEGYETLLVAAPRGEEVRGRRRRRAVAAAEGLGFLLLAGEVFVVFPRLLPIRVPQELFFVAAAFFQRVS